MPEKIIIILLSGAILGYVISMQFWAFFTAPWIREQGHGSSNWKIWFFGFPETFDLGKAVRIALKEQKHIPWPLWYHLAFQALQVSCIVALVLIGIIGSSTGNQQVDSPAKTPVDSGSVQGSAGHE